MVRRTTPFQPQHALEYALEIVECKPSGATSIVTSVRCRFCVYHSRDDDDENRKRKRTSTIKFFSAPFLKQNYDSHMKQHSELWTHYSALSNQEKKTFFDGKEKLVNTMHAHMDTTKDAIKFTISLPIVDVIVKDLFYRDEDQIVDGIDDQDEDIDDAEEEDHAKNLERVRKQAEKKIANKRNAVKLFKINEDETAYDVSIPNTTRFMLAMRHVGSGMSFRQTAAAIGHAKDLLKAAKLSGINDHIVGQYVRVLVAANLQKIGDLLLHPDVWAFSFAGDGSTHCGSSFFDMRVRVCVNGSLFNLHLVAIPMFVRHTALNTFVLIEKMLDALSGVTWRSKILSVSTDGENTMTGRFNGVVTRLERASKYPLLRIWCAPHQIDLVIKNATALLQDGDWIDYVYKWCVHLRRQDKLVIDMNGVQCPKKTNRWAHLNRTLGFYITYRRKIVEHTNAHPKFTSPTTTWWIITLALAPSVSVINNSVVKLQNQQLIIVQQKQIIDALKIDLLDMFKVVAKDNIQDADYYIDGDWGVARKNIVEFIYDQGSFSKQCFIDLNPDDQSDVVQQIARYAVNVIVGLDRVKAERDSDNIASEHEAPPVLPVELVKMAPRVFNSDVLDVYRPRLREFWSDDKIDIIEQHHRELLRRYNSEPAVKNIIDSYKYTVDFDEAWDKLGIPFVELRQFCGGLATSFPNTTSVESDFSILKWELDPNRSSLTDLSLEGIFQAKQLDAIPEP
jgi:hypothetical protein